MEVIDVEATDVDPLFSYEECSLEKNKAKSKGKSKDSKHEHVNSEIETCSAEVQTKLKIGCECGNDCFKDLDADGVYKHRLNIAELSKEEHDMYLMGVTMASLQNRQQTTRKKERQRQRASYVYHGRRVCLDAFLYLENVSVYHLKIIRSHVMSNGVTPRVHGNIGKKPHNSYSLDAYKCAETFVKNLLSNKFKVDVAPTKPIIVGGISRMGIYEKFKESGHYPNEKLMGFGTFRHFMSKQFPLIKFSKKTAAERDSKTSVIVPLCNSKEILIRSRNNKSQNKNSVKVKTKPVKSENKSDNDHNLLDLDNKKILSTFLSPDESISVVNSELFQF